MRLRVTGCGWTMKETKHTRQAISNLRLTRSNADGLVERRGKKSWSTTCCSRCKVTPNPTLPKPITNHNVHHKSQPDRFMCDLPSPCTCFLLILLSFRRRVNLWMCVRRKPNVTRLGWTRDTTTTRMEPPTECQLIWFARRTTLTSNMSSRWNVWTRAWWAVTFSRMGSNCSSFWKVGETGIACGIMMPLPGLPSEHWRASHAPRFRDGTFDPSVLSRAPRDWFRKLHAYVWATLTEIWVASRSHRHQTGTQDKQDCEKCACDEVFCLHTPSGTRLSRMSAREMYKNTSTIVRESCKVADGSGKLYSFLPFPSSVPVVSFLPGCRSCDP